MKNSSFKKNSKQFFKFLISSGFAIFVSLGTTYFFNEIIFQESFRYSYMVAYSISIVTSGLTEFLLQKFWTFESKKTDIKTLTKEYKKFFSINVLITLFNLLAMFLLTSVLGIYYLLSQIYLLIQRKIILFYVYRKWTFNKS